MSAFGAKADALHMSAFDPKRTSAEISGGPQPNSQQGHAAR